MIFVDRVDAGRRLAATLGHLRGVECVISDHEVGGGVIITFDHATST